MQGSNGDRGPPGPPGPPGESEGSGGILLGSTGGTGWNGQAYRGPKVTIGWSYCWIPSALSFTFRVTKESGATWDRTGNKDLRYTPSLILEI